MDRPSRDLILMEHAQVSAQRSTCSRARVGVVIARNARILTTGYNGAPKHIEHCDHKCTCGFDVGLRSMHADDCLSKQPCDIAVHAEANAIAYAARYGIPLKESVMYCTHMPCLKCAQLIINAGIDRVVYDRNYRLVDGIDLLQQAGILVEKFA